MDKIRIEENFWTRYERLDKIGQGAFGRVYLIRHIRSKKLFALKIIASDFKRKEREYLIYEYIRQAELERDESYALSSTQCYKAGNKRMEHSDFYYLDHPGQDRVLRIHDKFYLKSGDKTHFAVSMRYVKGVTLNHVRGSSPEIIKKMAVQIFEGLAYLHSLDIAHCDIKLSNIMWDSDTETITILDLAGCCIYNPSSEYKIYDYRRGFGITREFACPYVLKAYVGRLKPLYYELFTQGDIWSASLAVITMLHSYPFPKDWCKEVKNSHLSDWYEFLAPSISKIRHSTDEVGKIAAKGLVRTGERPSAVEMVRYFSGI